MGDLLKVFLWMCGQDTNYHCTHVYVYPSTWCAAGTGIPLRRVRDAMHRLEKYGYVRKGYEGGYDDWNERIYCVHGYTTTEKGVSTAIWRKFDREEMRRINEEVKP